MFDKNGYHIRTNDSTMQVSKIYGVNGTYHRLPYVYLLRTDIVAIMCLFAQIIKFQTHIPKYPIKIIRWTMRHNIIYIKGF